MPVGEGDVLGDSLGYCPAAAMADSAEEGWTWPHEWIETCAQSAGRRDAEAIGGGALALTVDSDRGGLFAALRMLNWMGGDLGSNVHVPLRRRA